MNLETPAEEERKLENQRARLEANKRQSEVREKELAIKVDKKLSEAEKTRKIKKLRECEFFDTKLFHTYSLF